MSQASVSPIAQWSLEGLSARLSDPERQQDVQDLRQSDVEHEAAIRALVDLTRASVQAPKAALCLVTADALVARVAMGPMSWHQSLDVALVRSPFATALTSPHTWSEVVGSTAVLASPILGDTGLPVALLLVGDHDDRSWDPPDVQRVRAAAQVIGRELHQTLGLRRERAQAAQTAERQAQALQDLALTDELTGLNNRRAFLGLARQHLLLARRHGEASTVIALDVDGFKALNVSQGHTMGDVVLQDFAEALQETFRGSDVLARLGGDEFVVLVNRCDALQAEISIARLRERLQARVDDGLSILPLTVSVGYAVDDGQSDLDALLVQAEDHLHHAQRARRHAA